MLYLQDNWTTKGVVGSGVDCYGAAVPQASMTCISEGYGYDNLNRLWSAGETFYQNPKTGAGYSRNFHYDEYGNMSVSAYSNGPASGLMPQTSHNPFNTANNRLTSATYDPRGNMTLIAANSVQMSYDGESRQTQTVDPGTGQTANYLYDASGQRVQKLAGGVTTVYVHDVYGQLVAVYNSAGITPVCTTCYLTYDQIGSVRLITDQNASVVGRHDYVPYGEEIFSGTGGRSGNGFGSDATVAQMFTGQARDGGTAVLDYFNARHLSAVLGSFTQPDPGNAGADITRPQSWNAYGYVLGNPLGFYLYWWIRQRDGLRHARQW